MKFNYDTVADAVYLIVNKGRIQKTIEMGDSVTVDMGTKGKIIGIEILNFSHQQKNGMAMKKFIKSGVPIQVTEGSLVTA